MTTPWLGYHRISRIGGRVDTPVSEREFQDKVTGFAERKGWEVELLPVEKDQTGSKLKRPILEAAIRRIEAGQAAGLIVVRYNRLSRATASDTHLIIERVEDGARRRVHSVEEDYPDTPEGRMARGMAFNVSRMEWERSGLTIRASKKRAVQEGIWPFPKVPPGYTVVRRKDHGDGRLKPDPQTVPTVRAAFQARAAGASWAEIADSLGVGVSSAAKIVRNRVYLGEIRLRNGDGEEFVNRAAHPAVVDRGLFESAQVEHPPPARRGNGRALLAGLVYCAACGSKMTPNMDPRSGDNYRCTGKPKKAGRCKAPAIIGRKKADSYVEAVVLPHLEHGQVEARAKESDLAEIEARLAEAETERDLYAQVTRVSDFGAETFMAGMTTRQATVDEAARELGEAKAQLPVAPGLGNVGELWEGWTTDQRRTVLRGALARLVVLKGRGPAEGRVKIIAAGFPLEGDTEGELGPLARE